MDFVLENFFRKNNKLSQNFKLVKSYIEKKNVCFDSQRLIMHINREFTCTRDVSFAIIWNLKSVVVYTCKAISWLFLQQIFFFILRQFHFQANEFKVSCFKSHPWFSFTIFTKENGESTEGCSKWMVRKKNCSQQVEHMQVLNGTGPGVRRSKRPLSACHTRRKCSLETSQNSVKDRVR